APLAFFMGMPFPQGLNLLTKISPDQIPWAWGINGCASVVSSAAASIIAIHYGFSVVILLALLAYILAGVLFLNTNKALLSSISPLKNTH
ncbi:MAG: hypothetical protein R3240_07035, partial [Gammaproteobacteria bacterium]|nr:hypothetical protein [Gammaproteobacteria bacterium]